MEKNELLNDVAHTILVHGSARNSLTKIFGGRNYKVGVEIGVQYGLNAENWLQQNLVEKLYGIDPYDSSIRRMAAVSCLSGKDEESFAFALGKLHRFGDRYIHMRSTSNNALLHVPGLIDCIYIDGDKSKEQVMNDVTFWFPKIRDGGIMAGHDYGHSSYPYIKRIVDWYIKDSSLSLGLEEGGVWWIEKGNMKKNPLISVIIPSYNTGTYFKDLLPEVAGDIRVGEVIVVDDKSDPSDWQLVKDIANIYPKIKLYENMDNLGELKNKIHCAELATNDWIVLLDGDNKLSPNYVDQLYKIPQWREDVIYCPDFGNDDRMDFRLISGNYINLTNIKSWLRKDELTLRKFLNTGNYFANRREYLKTARTILINKEEYGDVVFNDYWLRSSHHLFVVSGMDYYHRIRKESAWKSNWSTMQPVMDRIIKSYYA